MSDNTQEPPNTDPVKPEDKWTTTQPSQAHDTAAAATAKDGGSAGKENGPEWERDVLKNWHFLPWMSNAVHAAGVFSSSR